jgi:hypothetical protein
VLQAAACKVCCEGIFGVQRFDFHAMRRKRMEGQLAAELAGPCNNHALSEPAPHIAAKAYIELALRDEFTIGRGAMIVARQAALHGIGFLRDAQNPQLGALFHDDIRADEPWRLALLQQWADWHASRGNAAAIPKTHARLTRLSLLLRDHGAAALSQDAAAVYHAIDQVKTVMFEPAHWRRVAAIWQGYFRQTHVGAAQSQIDYACAVSFCCGQYFSLDPLWDRLADLRPDRLSSLVN